MGAVLAGAAIWLGVAAIRRPRTGEIGLLAFGTTGLLAAVTRPSASLTAVVPAIAGTAGGLVILRYLLRATGLQGASRARPSGTTTTDDGAARLDRRRFMVAGAVTAAVAATSGLGGQYLVRRMSASSSRAAIKIPRPSHPARRIPAGADLRIPDLSSFITSNGSFYRIDTALIVPAVAAEGWRLRIHGMVDRELTLDYRQLMSRPTIERDITLTCVSNPVGGPYIGNARWIGVPLKPLLEEAGVRPGADQIVSRSADGFTAGTPTSVAMDGRDAMLAIAMNGEALPLEHGFPVRMIVPGLYGYVSATKWLVDLELTTFDAFTPYWAARGWAKQAPVKTQSRIDTPRAGASLRSGEVAVAGVAWAQHRGIDRVEVRVDDGPWVDAELAAEDTIDTWRQWVYRWDATAGDHRLAVRATDGTGATQTSRVTPPAPDGATGDHTIAVILA